MNVQKQSQKKLINKEIINSISRLLRTPRVMFDKEHRKENQNLIEVIRKEVPIEIHIPRYVWQTSSLISVAFFILYCLGMSRGAAGYAYSDELLATAYNAGLGRPPGHLLYMFLLHFFLNLPIPFTTVALRGHILSALFQCLALVFTFSTVWIVLEYIWQKKRSNIPVIFSAVTDKLVVSGIVTSIIASSPLIWIYASVAEVPAFSNLIISLIAWLGVQLILRKNVNISCAYLLVVLTVVGIINVPATIFILPFVAAVLFFSDKVRHAKQIIALVSLMGITALLHYGILLLLSTSSSTLGWYLGQGIEGLVSYFTDNSFRQNIVYQQFGKHVADTIPVYFSNLMSSFGWLTLVIMITGVFFLYKISKRTFWIAGVGFGLISVAMPVLLSWASDKFTQVLILRQYAGILMLFALPISIGIWILFGRFYKALLLLTSHNQIVKSTLLGVSILGILFRIVFLAKDYNFKALQPFADLHSSVLADLPSDSMLVCKDDTSCSSLLFAQQILGKRKDIIILPTQYPLVKRHIESRQMSRFDYPANPYIIFDYVSWNIGKRPVFMMGATQTLHDVLGMGYGFSYYVPYGYVGELVHKLPDKLPAAKAGYSQAMRELKFKTKDPMFATLQDAVAQYHMFNALIYEKMGYKDIARDELNVGTNILYTIHSASDEKVEEFRVAIESMNPVTSWALGTSSQKAEEVLPVVVRSIEQKRLSNAYAGALGVLTVDPTNIKARLLLADIYNRLEQPSMAIMEYKNVLKLDPGNAEALQRVEALDSK